MTLRQDKQYSVFVACALAQLPNCEVRGSITVRAPLTYPSHLIVMDDDDDVFDCYSATPDGRWQYLTRGFSFHGKRPLRILRNSLCE